MTALALTCPTTSPWPRALAVLGFAAALILLLFARDFGAMAWIWWDSSTFGHCLLIPPIIAGLVWQRRAGLAGLVPTAWPPALALVALGAIGWLLGEAAGVALARHLGLVLMLQGTVASTLGYAVTRALLFPIAYALFLVPAGEELIAPLQTLTAEMTIGLLHLTRVPAEVDGVFITTPTGYFEVAEACSGIQFLVAMIAFGALAAHLCFTGWSRRIAFMAVAGLVPVLANGVRAWGTIYVSWLTDTNFAAGFDHVVFGWIFFGIVIAVALAIGWRFFDRPADAPFFDPAALQPVRPDPDPRSIRLAGLGALLIACAPVAWSVAARPIAREVPPIAMPELPGWTPMNARPGHPWTPHYAGADQFAIRRYRDGAGRTVDLAIAVYASQEEGRELVGFGQGPVAEGSDWAWGADTAPPPGGKAERISAPGPVVREVLSFYRVGDVLTGSSHRVKIATLQARLLGGPQSAVAVLVSAEGRDARAAADAFLDALGPVDQLADRAAAR